MTEDANVLYNKVKEGDEFKHFGITVRKCFPSKAKGNVNPPKGITSHMQMDVDELRHSTRTKRAFEAPLDIGLPSKRKFILQKGGPKSRMKKKLNVPSLSLHPIQPELNLEELVIRAAFILPSPLLTCHFRFGSVMVGPRLITCDDAPQKIFTFFLKSLQKSRSNLQPDLFLISGQQPRNPPSTNFSEVEVEMTTRVNKPSGSDQQQVTSEPDFQQEVKSEPDLQQAVTSEPDLSLSSQNSESL
ncbi:hypothetical protein J6590_071829 [Homalodisca vitripennis]|nr:hypothetical protein J6590_071829 [Homalodisca vitripennis]